MCVFFVIIRKNELIALRIENAQRCKKMYVNTSAKYT